jgi:hypothetical protein
VFEILAFLCFFYLVLSSSLPLLIKVIDCTLSEISGKLVSIH